MSALAEWQAIQARRERREMARRVLAGAAAIAALFLLACVVLLA